MWQRFTEKARRAVFFAQEEAGEAGYNVVGTEHLLLGLLRIEDSAAWGILQRIGIDPFDLKRDIKGRIVKGDGRTRQDMQLTPRCKRVIDLAYDEARQLNNNYIGTEHLLLGLIREGEGEAAKALAAAGADIQEARLAANGGKPVNTESKKNDKPLITDEMRGRDLLSIRDLTTAEVWKIFEVANGLKGLTLKQQIDNPVLPGKTLAMIFEKPSLRTRVTFETGMTQLGGHAIYLQPSDISLGKRETIADAARNFERMVQGIMARVFAHSTVTELAKYASVPVINGLSDLEHPCQALADFLTIYQHKGDLKGLKVAFIGDGNENTLHSLMLLAAKLGTNISIGSPEGYAPDPAIWDAAKKDADANGSTISITTDPFEAVDGADAIYTDIWASMGQEDEYAERMRVFRPYQVNQALVDAAKDDVIVLHCLPAHRGDEITDEVIDGPHSVVFDEAENRLHAQKAVMALVM